MTAGEFIDIRGKVTGVVVMDDAGARLGEISDPAVISRLVDDLLSAKFDDSPGPEAAEALRLEFGLLDGTTWTTSFAVDHGRIWPGIHVPESFTAAILAAIGR